MADNSRITRSLDEAYPFIINVVAYLNTGAPTTNAVRLGWLATETAAFLALTTQYVQTYPKYADKKNSRTTAIKDLLHSILAKIRDMDKTYHLWDRIAASPNVTIADLETFNIKSGSLQKMTRTVVAANMSETVNASITPIGGGTISVKCRRNGGRASIIDGADSVQYLYVVGTEPPKSADDIFLTKEISTKAIFTLSLGSANSSKIVYMYFRWYNTRHPELSGPWSSMQMMLIL